MHGVLLFRYRPPAAIPSSETIIVALAHELPFWITPENEIWFLTICCHRRGLNQLACEPVGANLISSIAHYHTAQKWWVWAAVVMPDHLHLLVSTHHNLINVISHWKRWTASRCHLQWQRDFFEHRLRLNEHVVQKAQYILDNPVRAGLVKDRDDWPYLWVCNESVFTGFHR